MHASVYLALGAREGDPETQMIRGVRHLHSSGLRLLASSSLWETEPVGIAEGPPVLNAAIHTETLLTPEEVLAACLSAEESAGRRRTPPEWRSLDVDVLLYDDLILSTPALVLPHPRFHSRRFNLEPLSEIAPELRHPVLRRTIGELLASCDDRSWARVRSAAWGSLFVERGGTIR